MQIVINPEAHPTVSTVDSIKLSACPFSVAYRAITMAAGLLCNVAASESHWRLLRSVMNTRAVSFPRGTVLLTQLSSNSTRFAFKR